MPALRITLEDLLGCWRAAAALGGAQDAELAGDIARTVVVEMEASRTMSEARFAGDRSLASAATRVRGGFGHRAPSLSNADDLQALAAVVGVLSSFLRRQEESGGPNLGSRL